MNFLATVVTQVHPVRVRTFHRIIRTARHFKLAVLFELTQMSRYMRLPVLKVGSEGFFAKLTRRRLKRGVFLSVVDLQAAINRFVVEHNTEPKPFTWTADPNKIIAAVRRGHQVLDSLH